MTNLTRLSLSHNRISVIPPSLADLENLEILNLFNNHIDELPTSLSSLPKLRILNLGSVGPPSGRRIGKVVKLLQLFWSRATLLGLF